MADKFIVVNENGMRALPHVLRKYRKTANVYSIDGSGARAYTLGWDDRPDSDWGKYRGPVLRVIVPNPDYHRPVEDEIRKMLKWEPIDWAAKDAEYAQ